MQTTILITGGAGYIGSHTAVALQEHGYTPLILDNFSNTHRDVPDGIRAITGTPVRCIEGDCRDTKLLEHLFAHERIGGVIHFAALKAVGESVHRPLDYYENNLMSLLALLRVATAHATAHNTTLPVIFSSSATVYGDADTMPVTEDTPRRPATNPYGNTKAIAEDILRDTVTADAPLCAIALRYFNPIGAHPSGHIGERPTGTPANLVPYLTQAAAGLRSTLTIHGNDYDTPDGTGIRDYIHVMDLATAHVAALRHAERTTAPQYDVFNIGTGRGTSVNELITTFHNVTGVSVPHTVGPRRPGDVATCYADVTKAHRILQWRAQYTIADALRDAWNFQQRQR